MLGRVLPDQKKAIVQALHLGDHVVAMTGDGVNDALAIKEADLGIAMGNAAPATKAVAQVVLVDSKFSHLPDVVARGRQVMANMERVASLFLVKTVYSALISLGVVLTQIPFPYLPRHITYIGALTIGMPAFILALAPNTRRYIPASSGVWCTSHCREHRHGSVDSRRFVVVAEVHGLGRTAFRRAAGHASWRQRDYPADDGHLRTGARGPSTQLVERRSGIGVRVAGVAGMFIPPVARFFALVIPSGEMLAATGIALVVSAIIFVLCLWCVPKIVAIFSRFKKTRQC